MTPAPGDRLQRFVGDRLHFALKDRDGRGAAKDWRAVLRTNLGRAEVLRREIIQAHTQGLPLAGAANRGALRNPNDRFWRKHSPAQFRVRVATSRGAFVLEVHRDWAPIGADRFYNLVRAGFYDDSRFYRVTARFAQFGIPGNPAAAAVFLRLSETHLNG